MTDEELEALPLLDCPSCDSHNTSVRRASNDWWLVGCLDCWNKKQCTREYVVEQVRDCRALVGGAGRHFVLPAGMHNLSSLGAD